MKVKHISIDMLPNNAEASILELIILDKNTRLLSTCLENNHSMIMIDFNYFKKSTELEEFLLYTLELTLVSINDQDYCNIFQD